MKTREERPGRPRGRSRTAISPEGQRLAGGPSPFISRPTSPVVAKTAVPRQQDHAATSRSQHNVAAELDQQASDKHKGSTHAPSQAELASDSQYPPPQSPSYRLRGSSTSLRGAPSFMAGSWMGYSSKAGLVGMGSHSLMQMINAIGLETAQEEAEDALMAGIQSEVVSQATSPVLGTELGVKPPSPSVSASQQGTSNGESSDSDDQHIYGRMRATVGGPYGAFSAKKSRRSMSSSIDAIHSRLVRKRNPRKPAMLPSVLERSDVLGENTHPASTGAVRLASFLAGPSSALSSDSHTTHTADQVQECAESPIGVVELGGAARSPTQDGQPVEAVAEAPDNLLDEDTRRLVLAQKLQDIFDLPSAEKVIAEYPSWLFRAVLLQGFLYITAGHLCFYAHIDDKKGHTIRSGSLFRRYPRSIMQTKYWFTLKGDNLSWYSSAKDPYFPVDHISLHYVTHIEASANHDLRFKITTPTKVYRFAAESARSRQEWIKALRKVAFRSRNAKDTVKITIPLSQVVKVESTEHLEFAKAIMRVETMESQSPLYNVPDDYYFSFPGDARSVVDTLLQHMSSVLNDIPAVSQSDAPPTELLLGSPPLSAASFVPASASRLSLRSASSHIDDSDLPALDHASPSASLIGHTYPPAEKSSTSPDRKIDSNGVAWTTWVRHQPRKILALPGMVPFPGRLPFFGRQSGEEDAKARPDSPSSDISDTDDEASQGLGHPIHLDEGFLASEFGLAGGEQLVFQQRCYITRTVPVFGTLYVTTAHICFSSQSILTNTKMLLPLEEVFAVQRTKPLRFNYTGLALIVRGHEELFFEISSANKRDHLMTVIEQQLQSRRPGSPHFGLGNSTHDATPSQDELADLKALHTISDTQSSPRDASAIMFSSATSSFITFEPPQPLHITCLTVGSRGDVQPYIALCRGLIKEGHTCRIASHPEYRNWIESYGIEFRPVGGDPAELMRICVENGMFTVSFLREGVAKFRGWLDDLLRSAWEACEGTELLIESPSTMAGIHIAEALQIPFFRAFTMPWTRTRAYPHAFAVPETKMGGGYNYMSYTIFDQVFWLAISAQVNRWRKEVLGLPATSAEKLQLHKVPFLYNFSPTIVPPPLDWMEYVHVTGYWHLDNADVSQRLWTPPPALLDFIDAARKASKKLVYIGFGSIVVSDPAALTRMVMEAIEQAGVCAVVSKGWSDRIGGPSPEAKDDDEAPVSPNVFNIASIPHDWLFPRVDAVCHHGGAGTTGASLRAGKPTIIKPFFGDQAFWAERVETLRVGVALRRMTSTSLAEALVLCTHNELLVRSAARVGELIRQETGVATAIQAIYRDLEYAKSLTQRRGSKSRTRAATDGVCMSDASSDWDIVSEQAKSAVTASDSDTDTHSDSSDGPPIRYGQTSTHTRAQASQPPKTSTADSIRQTFSLAKDLITSPASSRSRS